MSLAAYILFFRREPFLELAIMDSILLATARSGAGFLGDLD